MPDADEPVLVTGAGGFIGAHLVRQLLRERPRTVVYAQCSPGRELPLSDPRVRPLPARLSDIGRALSGPAIPDRFDGVFHLAAYTPKAAGSEDQAAVVEANVVGLMNLLNAVAGRTDRLVFASTLDVYGRPAETISETTPLRPENAYAASKILGEQFVRGWAARTGAHLAVLRVGHIYGPGEEAYQKLIPNTIRALLAGRPALRFGSGAESRDFLYVVDAARFFVAAWEAIREVDLGPLNLVSGRSVSVGEILDQLCGLIEGARLEERPTQAPPRSFHFDARALALRLPLDHQTSLADGLRAEVEWFRSAQAAQAC